MSATLDITRDPALYETPVSDEVRQTVLDRALAEQTAQGWKPDMKADIERVLVGHKKFRRVLVRRQWHVRNLRELVEVDKHGERFIHRV